MELASPVRMVFNAVVVAFILGVILYGESPVGFDQPGEMLGWVLEVAAAYPHFAVPAVLLSLGAIVFGNSSNRGVRIGER